MGITMNKMNGKVKLWLIITLCLAIVAFTVPFMTAKYKADSDAPVVIVLDPGHGGPDFGACNRADGIYESELNLTIARACYAELQRYDGVVVYMTHDGLDAKGKKMTLGERVRLANSVDADILISLHCNDAQSDTASGAEVYVSHSTYKEEYNEKSTELAVCFLKGFRELGFEIRGVKTRLSNGSRQYYHSDGTQEVGDYYAVIGDTIKYYAIPGILVEHGFVKGDAERFDTDEELVAIGISDAHAIAEYYGLTLKEDAGDSPTADSVVTVYLTDEERNEVTALEEYILSLPIEISLEDEFDVEKIKETYNALTPDQLQVMDDEVVSTFYQALLQLEYLRYPVRLEVREDENLFINMFDKTISGFEIGEEGVTVEQIIGSINVGFDMNALVENEKYTAEEQLIAEEVFNPTSEQILERAKSNVNDYLLNAAFNIIMTDQNGEVISGDELVGNGCQISIIADMKTIQTVTVILSGDISGDGIVDSLDNLMLSRYVSDNTELTEVQLFAADMNGDGVADAADSELLAAMILG